MSILHDPGLLRRAYGAWFRECARDGTLADMPSETLSDVEEHGGKEYVVLRNGGGILRAYRVRNDGKLKALRRLPKTLTEES